MASDASPDFRIVSKSSIIVELAHNVSPKMKYGQVNASAPKDTFPSASYEGEDYQCLQKCNHRVETDVSH